MEILNPGHLSIYISLGSLLTAGIAAFISYRSQRLAKRSLQISEEQASGRRPLLVPYLIDGFTHIQKDIKRKIYAFSISLTNRSDTDNAVAGLDFLLTYYRPQQPMACIVLPHNRQLDIPLNVRQENILATPLKISAHETVIGWVLFDCDNSIISDAIIDSYEIRITDSNGIYSKLKPIIITEIINDKIKV